MPIILNSTSYNIKLKLDGLRSLYCSSKVSSINELNFSLSNLRFSNILTKNNNCISFEIIETMGHKELMETFRFSGFFDEAALNQHFNISAPSWSFLRLLDEEYFITTLFNKSHIQGNGLFDSYLSLINTKPSQLIFSAHFPNFCDADIHVPFPTAEQFFDGMPLILENAAFNAYY